MHELKKAVQLIEKAEGLLIMAGAGIGVDSGLPDFRGNRGFWCAYPALGRQKISFEAMTDPSVFATNPRRAWGFYGHCLQLYRNAIPHVGFQILLAWAKRMQHGAYVYTSNLDGQFQKAGFDALHIVECHGSIHYLQCTRPCSASIWSAENLSLDIDIKECLLRSALPECPHCGALARPNVLLFNDWPWISSRTDGQEQRYSMWRKKVRRLLIIEIGAGVDLLPSGARAKRSQRQ
ncbi:MAG TPA: Sir2 family NAD-dependent protein deacetylase [Noviherbaspirillum sp.]|nr:Sir2 family NAD-dependent protein deacetylase [Noviherbaspirillum sp.]